MLLHLKNILFSTVCLYFENHIQKSMKALQVLCLSTEEQKVDVEEKGSIQEL